MFITSFLALSFTAEFDSTLFSNRIVSGKVVAIDEIPYQVSIKRLDYPLCGGSIISSKVVLTAAHCLQQSHLKHYAVMAGSASIEGGERAQVRNIERFENHPEWNYETLRNDISVIFVDKAFNLGSNVLPIPLPRTGLFLKENTTVTVSGWGIRNSGSNADYSSELLRVNVSVISGDQCYETYDQFWDGMMCASNRLAGPCRGDDGGPLTHNGIIVGIVSFFRGCGSTAVYTRVSHYVEWINKIVQ